MKYAYTTIYKENYLDRCKVKMRIKRYKMMVIMVSVDDVDVWMFPIARSLICNNIYDKLFWPVFPTNYILCHWIQIMHHVCQHKFCIQIKLNLTKSFIEIIKQKYLNCLYNNIFYDVCQSTGHFINSLFNSFIKRQS